MIVSLKVPDTTAITALHTIQNIGFKEVTDVKREEYYKFSIEGNQEVIEKFKDGICKVDMLVNANKNFYSFSVKKEYQETQAHNNVSNVRILVKNLDDGDGLLKILKKRLGFKNIKEFEKGTLWTLYIDSNKTKSNKKNIQNIAKDVAEQLLANTNYQEYTFLE